MQVIRRLYLYAMCAVTLIVLAVGLRLLLGVLLDTLGLAGDPLAGGGGSREQLSLAGALIGVGLPVWAIHWWQIRRSMRPGAPEAQEERGSAIRAIYLSGVMAVALVFAVNAAIDLVGAVLRAILGATTSFGGQPDVAGLLATFLIAASVWAYHVLVRRADMAAGPLTDGAAWWPRIYLYGVMFVALIAGIGAIRQLFDAVAELFGQGQPAFGDGRDLALVVASQLAAIVVLAAGFVIHAWYAERLLDDPGWRGASERPARARVAFFGAVLGIAAVYVLIELMSAGRAILVEVLGIAEATAAASGQRPPTLARAIVVPLLGLMPWLLAGVAARRQALAEAGRSGLPGRPMSVARLEEYLVSLIGLAFGAVALGWLFGLAIDALLGGNRVAVSGSDWKLETASFMPAAVLGLALWAWRWSWVVVQSSADPVSEAGSSIRRTALLAVLAVSIIASVASLGLILYRLFGSLLGIEFGENIVSALSTPVGALVVAAAVATYHGLLVRRDSELRAQQAGAAAATPELLAAVPAVEPVAIVQRTLVLRAASAAELDAAVQMIRAGLPLGTRLDDA